MTLEIRCYRYFPLSLRVVIIFAWMYILYTGTASTARSTCITSSLIIMFLKVLWWSLLLMCDIEGRIHLSDTGPWRWGQHGVSRRRTYATWCFNCSWFLFVTDVLCCTILRIDVGSWLRRQFPWWLKWESSTNINTFLSWDTIHLVTWASIVSNTRGHFIWLWTS